MAGQGVVYESL
jgi:2-oxoglutarate dehydrogenase E1 component